MNIKFDKIVYIDSEFVSSKYEEITNIHPETEFTKIDGGKAGVSLPMFFARVHTQESKKFKRSSLQMLSEIENAISAYPKFDEIQNFETLEAKLIWVTGKLSTSEWTDSKTKELDGEPFFYIGDLQSDHFPLITKPEYFMSGIDKFLSLPTPFQQGIGFPVKALIRVFYYSEHTQKYYISCPYIIYEENSESHS